MHDHRRPPRQARSATARAAFALAVCAALAVFAAPGTQAADVADVADAAEYSAAASSDAPLHCIALVQLREVKVLDARRIVFRTTGGKAYLSTLARDCPGLARDKAILYRPTLNQLCDLDLITVLETIGDGFTAGASCGLAPFVPLQKEDAVRALRKVPRGPRY